ncbi:MAG: TolC family protein [Arcobacteraceae bacterium]
MIKKICLLVIGLSYYLNATTVENILDLVEKNNAILKAKQKAVDSSHIDAQLANTWSNPTVGLGVSDINLDSPSKRDIEAMQTQFITYSQSIPTNGKLELETDIKNNDTNIKSLEYKEFKQKLQSQALLYSYSLYYEMQNLQIINKYIKNLEDQKELMNLLYENGKLDQSKLVTIDIKLYKQKLSQQKIAYKISNIQSSLANIIYRKIDTVEFSNNIHNSMIDLDFVLENHPLVLIEKEKIKQQTQQIELENRKKISDVKLTVGYYQRERFDDYLSFNVAIPLSIQGIEKLKIQKSKIQKNSTEDKLIGLQKQIETTIEDLQQKIVLSKQNFELIENKMIPLNETLSQSHKMHLSTNTMDSINIYESTNSKLELMLLVNDEKMNYFTALAQLYYFKGTL